MKVTEENKESDKARSTKGKGRSKNIDPCHSRTEKMEEED